MNDHGIRIATKDHDALTQLDKDVSWSSKFSTLKIFKKKHISITTNGAGSGSAAIPHGLGYAPAFYVLRVATASNNLMDSGNSYPNSYSVVTPIDNPWVTYEDTIEAYTDETSLHIVVSGANSTTYKFVYFIFIDQAEYGFSNTFSGEEYGIKISPENSNLNVSNKDANFLSPYRPLKFHKDLTISFTTPELPAISASYYDQTVEEGTYVDVMHNFNYPPFFLAFSEHPDLPNSFEMMPTTQYAFSPFSLLGWCDKERIRISYYREALYNTDYEDLTASSATITIYIFEEDLSRE